MSTPEAEVRVVPYDPAWPALFEAERVRLLEVLAPWLAGPIEHVGSTAVPGLIAKPVIDIMAGVRSLDASRGAIAEVERLQYQYWPYRCDVMHWFCKPGASFRTHHLHLVPHGSPAWQERIAFRDCLRDDATVAAKYAELKDDLARRYRRDREAYTEAKGPFIADVLKRASGPSDASSRCRIEPIDHRSRAMAERIHAIQIAAYSQEARLLGAVSFPPLQRTIADIEGSGEHFLGAYVGAALVGVLALEGDPTSASMVISSLVVLPAFQRMGIARSLLAAVVDSFPSRSLTVSTGERNAPALALYARFGFLEIRRHLAGPEELPLIELRRPVPMAAA